MRVKNSVCSPVICVWRSALKALTMILMYCVFFTDILFAMDFDQGTKALAHLRFHSVAVTVDFR